MILRTTSRNGAAAITMIAETSEDADWLKRLANASRSGHAWMQMAEPGMLPTGGIYTRMEYTEASDCFESWPDQLEEDAMAEFEDD